MVAHGARWSSAKKKQEKKKKEKTKLGNQNMWERLARLYHWVLILTQKSLCYRKASLNQTVHASASIPTVGNPMFDRKGLHGSCSEGNIPTFDLQRHELGSSTANPLPLWRWSDGSYQDLCDLPHMYIYSKFHRWEKRQQGTTTYKQARGPASCRSS